MRQCILDTPKKEEENPTPNWTPMIKIGPFELPDTLDARGLRDEMEKAAPYNSHYNPESILHGGPVLEELQAALEDADGEPLPLKKAEARIAALHVRFRARIGQILADPEIWPTGSVGCPKDIFETTPRSLLKTGEEVLVAPADYIPVSARESRTRHELDVILPHHMVIDPERISETVASHLGFSAVGKGRKSDIAQLEKKIGMIPHIRALFESLEFMHFLGRGAKRNYRLFRIGTGEQRGYILGSQEIRGADRLFRTSLPQAPIRMEHIQEGHTQEKAQLERIGRQLELTDQAIRARWETGKNETLHCHIDALKDLIIELKYVRDDEKVKLRTYLESAVRAIMNRNQGAAKTCIGKFRTGMRIKNRIENIESMTRHLDMDRDMLSSTTEHERHALERLYDRVKQQFKNSNQGALILDEAAPLSPEKRDELCRKILQLAVHCENATKFAPAITFAELMRYHLEAAAEALRGERPNRTGAAQEYMNAFVVSKTARIMHQLEDLHASSHHWKHGVDVESRRSALSDLRTEMNTRDVRKDIATPLYDELWKDLRLLIKNTEEIIEKLMARSSEKRDALGNDMRIKITAFDLPGRVHDILASCKPQR